ncbi:hypothetical protein MUK70_02665 [Dyadobacter chenwenxiniae]|uniref:Glycine zipper domain-containing protein n=1 Tax=Dyadobacter chenwenxiniae TaxID=2906456 RepID=A0A9X1PK13_9BACT|nr:hypothetical protein [Dyadobacter chenwenxiniae]MCF0062348.1 hypothetical protein [Dyadobacter chenwenxiniae]UON83896.1 hypothetical protein MUK70_02665 [Dyadobacter chenwenxiniae]
MKNDLHLWSKKSSLHTYKKAEQMKSKSEDIQSLNTPLNGGIACGLVLGVIIGPIGALIGVIIGATVGFYYDKKENS